MKTLTTLAIAMICGVAAADEPTAAELQKIKQFAELLEDKNPLVRKQAALVLADFGTKAKSAVPALRKALVDSDAAVREAVAKALEKIGPNKPPAPKKPTIEALLKTARDKKAAIAARKKACFDLVRFYPRDKQTRSALIDLMLTREMRADAAAALNLLLKAAKGTTVSGVIKYQGKPLSGGLVQLHPVEGKAVKPVFAKVDKQGRFEINRVPAGKHKVTIETNVFKRLPDETGKPKTQSFVGPFIPFSYAKATTTPVTVEAAGKEIRLELELKGKDPVRDLFDRAKKRRGGK